MRKYKYKTNKIIKYDSHAELLIYSREGSLKMVSKIDLEDVPYVEKYSWCERSRGYVGRVDSNGKIITLHRILAKAKKGEIVDHINKDKLDNRKENLRICTYQQNIFNSGKGTKNTSGVTGVGWRKDTKKWRAYIIVDAVQKTLGSFKEKDDAVKARLKAEKKYFKEFAPQKHLFNKYDV